MHQLLNNNIKPFYKLCNHLKTDNEYYNLYAIITPKFTEAYPVQGNFPLRWVCLWRWLAEEAVTHVTRIFILSRAYFYAATFAHIYFETKELFKRWIIKT